MTYPTTVRMSEATRAKLKWLAEEHHTQSEVIITAIERLYQAEQARLNPPDCEECGTPLAYVPPGNGRYIYQCDH